MIAGRFAFQGLSEYLTWQKIKQLDYTFPEGFDPEAADLVRRLLVRLSSSFCIGCSNIRRIMQVRDPLERLGAGPPEGEHSMHALRAHPFFASIRWDTLWDDPPPPLDTGLVRREPAPVDEWDDVGAAWDELVSGPDSGDEYDDDESVDGLHPHGNSHAHVRSRVSGDDGIEWAPDAQAFVSPPAIPPEEIGPHGEIPDYARGSLSLAEAVGNVDAVAAVVAPLGDVDVAVAVPSETTLNGGFGIRFTPPRIDGASKNATPTAGEGVAGPATGPDPTSHPSPGPSSREEKITERGSPVSTSTETAGGDGDALCRELPQGTSAPLPVPRGVRDSYATSSSDGSPVEKLGAALEAMGIHRGRLRTRSPTPARDAPSSVDAPDWCIPSPAFWPLPREAQLAHRSSVLGVGETILFHAPVEETALKRRTSRLLLPLPVAQRKPKARELTLTSHRLVCLKPLKNGRGVGLKAEFSLREAQGQGQLAGSSSGREKRLKGDEARGMVTGVERRGAKEFVVLTVRLPSSLWLPGCLDVLMYCVIDGQVELLRC